jgi:predicted nucleotidyltransferase
MKKKLDSVQKEMVIKNIREILKKVEPEVISAYIFGSFVRKDKFSDIDLALLFKTQIDKPLDFEIALEIILEDSIGYPFDVRVLNGAPPSFCQVVFRNGKLIVDSKPNFRSDFTGNILKQYFDFHHFRQRYLREVINA